MRPTTILRLKQNIAEIKKQLLLGAAPFLGGSKSGSWNYQYLHRSKTPTYFFQKSLPRLPIPKLSDTCDRYLRALKPILTENEFSKTELVVRAFQNDGSGEILNNLLVARDKENKYTSYISEWWFNMYLSDRTPLPINYNPCLIFVDDPNGGILNDQLVRATNLIVSSLRFYKSLKAKVLKPEVFHLDPKKSDTKFFEYFTRNLPESISWYGAYLFKAFPLDMSQYSNLFGTCRLPELGKDRLFQETDSRHIVVMHRGNFYTVPVLDEDGMIVEPKVILRCLHMIVNNGIPMAEHPVGILTTQSRDEWAKLRRHLVWNGNSQALNLIDSSIFAVSLDDNVPADNRQIVRNFLHSDGCNRWFDKSFTLIVTKNGTAGLNFEHSWGDGVAILRYFQDIFKDSTTNPFVRDTTIREWKFDEGPKRIEFNLDAQVIGEIQKAKQAFENVYQKLDLDYIEVAKIGRRFCKPHDLSPDALMQLAFQLAYWKLKKKQTMTYEACSTAAFKHGRTEAIRPCTIETKNFCLAAEHSKNSSNEQLRQLIRECSNMHTALTKKAAMGQGFDRHLFALKKIAEKDGYDLPELYTDLGYKTINYNALSTSTLSSDVVLGGGFGPVVQDGYGIAYMIKKDACGAVVTSYSGQSDNPGFMKCLNESFERIYSILNEN